MSDNIKLENTLKKGLLYKYFKGKKSKRKNIYKVLKLSISGKDILGKNIIYTGVNSTDLAYLDLVIYTNIFDGKIFAREYNDLVSELIKEQKEKYPKIIEFKS